MGSNGLVESSFFSQDVAEVVQRLSDPRLEVRRTEREVLLERD